MITTVVVVVVAARALTMYEGVGDDGAGDLEDSDGVSGYDGGDDGDADPVDDSDGVDHVQSHEGQQWHGDDQQ